jgi:hypothetical protein
MLALCIDMALLNNGCKVYAWPEIVKPLAYIQIIYFVYITHYILRLESYFIPACHSGMM